MVTVDVHSWPTNDDGDWWEDVAHQLRAQAIESTQPPSPQQAVRTILGQALDDVGALSAADGPAA